MSRLSLLSLCQSLQSQNSKKKIKPPIRGLFLCRQIGTPPIKFATANLYKASKASVAVRADASTRRERRGDSSAKMWERPPSIHILPNSPPKAELAKSSGIFLLLDVNMPLRRKPKIPLAFGHPNMI